MHDSFCKVSDPKSAIETAMNKATISIRFVEEALFEATRREMDVAALMDRVGLNPDLLGKPQARVTPEQYGALWHGLAAALDDEFFGMDAHPMRYGSFALLCHSLCGCTTLGHGLDRALRFLGAVLDDVRGSLEAGPDHACIRLQDRRPAPRVFAHGTLFVILYGLACWLTGRRLAIKAVGFSQPAPDHVAEYKLVFGQAVSFEQARSELVLEAKAMALPIIRDSKAATEFLRKAPANFIVKYRHEEGYVARIRKRLAATPFDTWPVFAELAASLHMTEPTLRRRLENEGLTYQSLKDDLRRDMAINLLCDTKASVEEIALKLGFKENSAFHRAFKKWTGLSPGAYRVSRAGRDA